MQWDDQVFETHLSQVFEKSEGVFYELKQSHNGEGHLHRDSETVLLNWDQAVQLARIILRTEGYDIE